jgi:hypothetical protein
VTLPLASFKTELGHEHWTTPGNLTRLFSHVSYNISSWLILCSCLSTQSSSPLNLKPFTHSFGISTETVVFRPRREKSAGPHRLTLSRNCYQTGLCHQFLDRLLSHDSLAFTTCAPSLLITRTKNTTIASIIKHFITYCYFLLPTYLVYTHVYSHYTSRPACPVQHCPRWKWPRLAPRILTAPKTRSSAPLFRIAS